MRKVISLTLATLALVLPAIVARGADAPVVNSFTVPSGLESGQILDISWDIKGGGHALTVFCGSGIKLRYVTNNQTFPCDTKLSVSSYASDGVSLFAANISGGPRIITVRIVPKDAGGAEYAPGAREATVYLNPLRQPISYFYSNATTTISGAETTLYWSSAYLDGVNLKIACDDLITATSSVLGGKEVPCGHMISQSDLPGTGSASFKFNNRSPAEVPLDVTLYPATTPGFYDGARSQTLTLKVASDAQKPVSIRFDTSRTKIFSGDTVVFDWTVANGNGANIKFACTSQVQMQTFSSATTTTLACGDYAWKLPLPAAASTSVTFLSSNPYDETVTATIFPYLKNGTYSGAYTQTVKINILAVPKTPASLVQPVQAPARQIEIVSGPKNFIAPSSGAVKRMEAPTAPATTPARTTTPASTPPVNLGENVFWRSLTFGTRGADVTLLQRFLAKDRSLYPEGLVTGVYGPATKRAVGRFQMKYGLVRSASDKNYGLVDTNTRTMLNLLQ